MGRRGPGSKRRVGPGITPPEPHVWPLEGFVRKPPWEHQGLQRWERVVAFVESLPVTSGKFAGTMMVLRPWQRKIIRDIYGDGPRVVRTAIWSMARKNGKTALAAALCLCHLSGPESEPRGQVYSAATEKTQATIIFKEMEAIIKVCSWLEERLNVKVFTKEIDDEINGSTYQAISAEVKSKHGFSSSFFVYDELGQATSRELWDVLSTSGGARNEPLGLAISTQAKDPLQIMSVLIDYGEKVNAGVIEDPTFYAAIWRVPEPKDEDDFDPFDESIWHLANPALGDFRSLEDMRTSARQCLEMPSQEPAFRNLYLNMRESSEGTPWLLSSDWKRCAGAVDLERLVGRPCYGGLDLASTEDLCAFALFWPDDADGGDLALWAWCPGDKLTRRATVDKVPYDTWAKQKLIKPTPGKATNKRTIARDLAELQRRFSPASIAYDRWGIQELNRVLAEDELVLPLEEFGQGYQSMSPAMKATEIMVAGGRLRHGGNPLLTWCVSNVVVTTDPAENMKPDKRKSTDRIDGAVAAIMAIGQHAKAPKVQAYKYSKIVLAG
jgi:phage terminase large subunit-like protein